MESEFSRSYPAVSAHDALSVSGLAAPRCSPRVAQGCDPCTGPQTEANLHPATRVSRRITHPLLPAESRAWSLSSLQKSRGRSWQIPGAAPTRQGVLASTRRSPVYGPALAHAVITPRYRTDRHAGGRRTQQASLVGAITPNTSPIR